jgi:hypothetical protein
LEEIMRSNSDKEEQEVRRRHTYVAALPAVARYARCTVLRQTVPHGLGCFFLVVPNTAQELWIMETVRATAAHVA